MKKINCIPAYTIQSENGLFWLVALERLKNNNYGNPRFKAFITFADPHSPEGFQLVETFNFTGHYYTEKEEAEWAIKEWEKNR